MGCCSGKNRRARKAQKTIIKRNSKNYTPRAGKRKARRQQALLTKRS